MNWHPFLSLSSVMFLQFVPKTHLFFTAGKDKKIKQWDADKFVLIQTLEVCFYPSLISPLSSALYRFSPLSWSHKHCSFYVSRTLHFLNLPISRKHCVVVNE